MTQDHPSHHRTSSDFQPRGADRRRHNVLSPPPYHAAEGLVLVDRRSPVDRRATWIKPFRLFERNGDAG